MIPKKIHYCWFGGGEMPEEVKRCIESWRIKMPDYEIIRWDESNYDIEKNQYMKEAYDKKKWAFVSDYARLDIIYNHGGIYLDVDVEAYRSFDNLLKLDSFCGREKGKKKDINYINTGLVLGGRKGSRTIGEMLGSYQDRHFMDETGKIDITPCTVSQSKFLEKENLRYDDVKQVIGDLIIFPKDYFCPMNQYTGKIKTTKNTYSIHNYYASWYDDVDRHRRELRMKYSRLGKIPSEIISTFIAYKHEFGVIKMPKEIIRKIVK